MMPDGRYSHVVAESEPDTLSIVQRAQTFRPGVRMPTVVICSMIAAIASVIGTYLTTHSAPVDCASSGELRTLSRHVDDLATAQTALIVTVNANADRENNHFAIVNGTLMALSRK